MNQGIVKTNYLLGVAVALMLGFIVAALNFLEQDKDNEDVIRIGREFYLKVINVREILGDAVLAKERASDKLESARAETDEAIRVITLLVSGGQYHGREIDPVKEEHIRLELVLYSNELMQLPSLVSEYKKAAGDANLQSKIAKDLRDISEILVARAAHVSDDVDAVAEATHDRLESALIVTVTGFVMILGMLLWTMRKYQQYDNQNARQLEEVLRAAEAQKYALDQHSIVAVTDVNGVITHVNDKFCEISGYSREELLGNTHRIINSGYHPKEFFAHMWRTLSKGEVWNGQVLNRAKGGQLYWVYSTIVPYKNERGENTQYIAIRTDITARKEYEKALQTAEQRLGRQNRVLRDLAKIEISDSTSLASVIKYYSEGAAAALQVSRVGVWIANGKGIGYTCMDSYDHVGHQHNSREDVFLDDVKGAIDCLDRGGVLAIVDLDKDERGAAIKKNGLLHEETSSVLISAIRMAGHVAGMVVCEQSGASYGWALDEQNFATSMADSISLKLEQDKRGRVEAGLRAIAKIVPAGKGSNFFAELARQLAMGLEMDYVAISRLSTKGDKLRSLAVWNEGSIGDNFTHGVTGGAHSLARNVAVSEQGLDVVLPRPMGEPVVVIKVRSHVTTPIVRVDGVVVGMISMWSHSATPSVEVAESMLQICAMRAAAELERMESEERLRSIVDSVSNAVWEFDSSLKFIYCSDKVADILGYDANELIGKSMLEMIVPDDETRVRKLFQGAGLNRSKLLNEEFWVVGRRNKDICLMCNMVPVFDDDDGLVSYRGVFSDVTARKNSELRARMLVMAIDQSLDGVLILDTIGGVEYANPAYYAISGRTPAAVIGNDVESMFGVDLTGMAQGAARSYGEDERFKYRRQVKRRGGSEYSEELSISPVKDHAGNIVNYIVGVRDVTGEAVEEQRERQTQKLEAIGTLAGGIAHDFNNILSAILGFAELTRDEVPADGVAKQNLTQIITAANRAKNLVARILAFSRQAEAEMTNVIPQTVTQEVIALLRSAIPSSIEIKASLNAPAAEVMLESGQFQQVAMNLIVNASHAIGERPGVINIQLDEIVLQEKEVNDLAAGDYVRLLIADNGSGISPNVLSRIFDPFFTTKPVGQGSGMGLAAVHGIVTAAKGTIAVSSEPGKGSRFEVYLPRVTAKTMDKASEKAKSMRAGKERLLIVDDEELQTSVMQRMLERLGYHVTVCNKPREALSLFKKNPKDFDLVITDQNMPEMTGDMLARELLHMRPELPVIMCTGYSQRVGPEEARQIGIREYMLKPVVTNDLNEALTRVLEHSAVS
ncbi:MAG: PAS domain S-box protein [Gammaproteobacteria bacterium]|nr:PAS domain S-box protein [Gammaproteobacteria bacterium]